MALRLDTVQAMDPGSPAPIGTLQEVRAQGLSPLKYGSCSMPGRNNIGCKHYEDPNFGSCPILQLCRAKNRKGYERVAFVRILSPTNMKQDACMCHQYMDTLAHADPRNGVTHVLGLGGDVTIKRRTSEPLDPSNPRSKMRSFLKVEKIEAAPRPSESMADVTANLQLARDLSARAAKSFAENMGTVPGSEVPAEDTVEELEGLTADHDGEIDADTDSDLALEDLDAGGDEDGDLDGDLLDDDPEPAVVAAVSGRKRGRQRKNG